MKDIQWINNARAFAIISVVIAHLSGSNLFLARILFSFNVSLFFLLSGLTFMGTKNYREIVETNQSWAAFLKKKTCTILYPYLLWGIISIIIYRIMGGFVVSSLGRTEHNFSILYNLIGLLYGNSEDGFFEWNRPLWFLICLFVIENLFYGIFKLIKKTKVCNNSIKLCLFGVCWLSFLWMAVYSMLPNKFYLPFEIETAIAAAQFFSMGIILKDLINIELNRLAKIALIIFSIPVIVLAARLAFYNGGVDFRMDFYGNPFLFVVVACLFSGVIISYSLVIGKTNVLNYIGKHTLSILVLHKFPIMFFQTILPYTKNTINEGNVIVIIICAILSISMSLCAELIINQIVPCGFVIQKLTCQNHSEKV